MKRFNEYISSRDWLVRVFAGTTRRDAPEIIETLEGFGCKGRNLTHAGEHLIRDNADTGLTFSNRQKRMSVIVIGHATSSEEFLNSLVHEITHLAIHIATTDKIDLQSEQFCYLSGDIAQALYPHCKHFLCCECHA